MSEGMSLAILNAFWFACLFWAVVLSLSVWQDRKAYKSKGTLYKTIILILVLLDLGLFTLAYTVSGIWR